MIEKKLSPLVESLFPQHYRENGPNFVAFVKAYFEFLEQNFQLLKLKSYEGFEVGSVITQGQTTGTVTAFVDDKILVLVDSFDTFKCVTMCSELVPVTSSSGGNTTIEAGGVTGRLGTLFWSRRLEELGDVDQTIDLFIVRFKEKYLKNIDFTATTNKPLLIKNSLDLYRSKGTARSVDLFFRLVYGSSASVYYPSKDLFKLSDAEWYKPNYIEVYTPNTSRIIDMIGKQIQGVTSGATAFVERYIKRKVQGGFVHLLYVSNVVGSFSAEELLRGGQLFADSPKITGSLNTVTIVNGSTSFNVGDFVDVYSGTGSRAVGRVTEVNSERGVVRFELLDGGWGFSLTTGSSPYTITETSDTILSVDGIVSSNTVGKIYQLFEEVVQYAGQAVYSGTFQFSSNSQVTIRNGSTVVNSGFIKAQISGTSANGTLTTILNLPYNLANGYTISLTANSASNVAITECYNSSAIGKVISSPTYSRLSVSNSSVGASFNVGDEIYQTLNGVEIANGVVTFSSVTPAGGFVELERVAGVFKANTLTNRSNLSTCGIDSLSTRVGLFSANNTFYTGYSCRSSSSNTIGVVSSISAGQDASFDVVRLDNTKNVFFDTQLLSEFSNTSLSSWSSLLYNQADMQNVEIGSIFALGNINPGSDYTAVPQTLVINPGVAALDRVDLSLSIANSQGSFIVGERLDQIQLQQVATFEGANATNFRLGERVYIGNTVVTTANGAVVQATGSQLVLEDVQGSWLPSDTIVRYANTQHNTTFTSSTTSTSNVVVSGTIKDANSSSIIIGRNDVYRDFIYSTVTGSISGAQGNVVQADEISSAPAGYNANVSSEVFTSNGTVVDMQIVDSGFGFANAQLTTFTGDGRIGYATGFVSGLGTGSGTYRTSTGFLSDASKLQDGDYYQEYSYDILSRIPFNLYKDMFNRVMHVAGTKFFGNLLIDSTAIVDTKISDTAVAIEEVSAFVLSSNTAIVTERDGDDITIRP